MRPHTLYASFPFSARPIAARGPAVTNNARPTIPRVLPKVNPVQGEFPMASVLHQFSVTPFRES